MSEYQVMVIYKKGHAQIKKYTAEYDPIPAFGRLVTDMETSIKDFWEEVRAVLLRGPDKSVIARRTKEGEKLWP